MIDISRYLNSDTIVVDLKAGNREEVIDLLLEKIYEGLGAEDIAVSREDAYSAVVNREILQSTGIGREMAFPHARIEGWGEFRMAMGVLREGVNFDALDGKPVKFVFLMISSTEQPYMVLQAMSAIIRFVGEMEPGKQDADDPLQIDKILDFIQKQEIKASDHVLACDIVRPVKDPVTLDTPLEEVTKTMHLDRISILPVVEEDNRYYGEISCYDIFTFGMPDFFRQLRTISFVRQIDPFEKYFSIKKGLKVRDLDLEKGQGINMDSTLLEIVFEMAVKRKTKLFVVNDNGILAGVIDRFCVIDKILFF